MGQVEYKRCSNGTFVSEQQSPGTTAADCVACPYGKYSVRFGQTSPFSINERTVTTTSLTHSSHCHQFWFSHYLHRTKSTGVDYQKLFSDNRKMNTDFSLNFSC